MREDRLCLALDVDTRAQAIALIQELRDYVGLFKIGSQLFSSEGPDILREAAALGASIFLDLKLHDIPNTVGATARVLAGHGVSMFNVHAQGGLEMMQAAFRAVEVLPARPRVLAVTVLTSIDESAMNQELRVAGPISDQVRHLALLAKEAGLDGVVASPREVELIRGACGPNFLILTPGIRPAQSQQDDQKRTLSASEAIAAGANFIVVGRPIYAAPSPQEAARSLIDEIRAGTS